MQIEQCLKTSQQSLAKAGIKTARLDTLLLLAKAGGVDREWLLANPERTISKTTLEKYKKLVAERAKLVPMSQLLGKQEFWGLEFKITKDVLAPRPESEKIVEQAIAHPGKTCKVLDVGTGCGALAVAIAKERPGWAVTASELSDKALAVAKANVKKHQVQVSCLKSDLLQNVKGRFDVVVANLPYLKKGAQLTAEAAKEPKIALFGGPDGLDLYRLFFVQLPPFLKESSLVVVESDPWQQPALIELAGSVGLKLKAQDRFVLSFTN